MAKNRSTPNSPMRSVGTTGRSDVGLIAWSRTTKLAAMPRRYWMGIMTVDGETGAGLLMGS
jgi:hypothetical protein